VSAALAVLSLDETNIAKPLQRPTHPLADAWHPNPAHASKPAYASTDLSLNEHPKLFATGWRLNRTEVEYSRVAVTAPIAVDCLMARAIAE
jgi:hypothetical protein